MQTLRSLLGDGLIKPLPNVVVTLLCLVLLCWVWVHSSTRLFVYMFVVAPVALFMLSLTLMMNNRYLPGIAVMASLWIAVIVRAIADALESAVEKNRLKQSFAGSVSPAVLHEMLAGNLQAGVSGQTAEVCVLFSDIRNFTGISEALTPEKVTELLTRYFDRMVAAVHHHDGTIDKFIGDGMMVLFGAPRPLPDACGNSVQCAWEMMQALHVLNEEFAAEGLPPLKIGIGINYGKVVVGNIGSTERHNYSAIGDAVNVASRLEGLTKRLATPIVMTDSGGVQEETAYLGVPCLTLRPNTERPVTIASGMNRLVASKTSDIVSSVNAMAAKGKAKHTIPELWDGHAAERIAAVLVRR